MQIGDHLVSTRLGYTHHGLYLGSDLVIHYSGLADGLSSGAIEITTLKDFCGDGGVSTRSHPFAAHTIAQRIARAKSRLGEDRYNVVTNNCEHFVNWCIDGAATSQQVTRAWSAVASTLGTVSPVAGSLVGGVGSIMAATGAVRSSGGGAEVATASLTKTVASSAATMAVAAVSAPVAIPLAVGTAAVYGIKKLISVFD